MKCIFCLAALVILTLSSRAETTSTEQWRQLFNGKNLDGWTPKIRGYDLNDNYGDTFRVEDGMLKVRYDKYTAFDARFGHLFYKDRFSRYRLRMEYRFTGDQAPGGEKWALRNSGVMILGQSPEFMRKDQDFPVSIEVQFLGGDGKNKRSTGNLCTPGTLVVLNGELFTPHCTSSSSDTFHGDQWVTAEVQVLENHVVKHLINGKEVMQYEKPQLDEKHADAKVLIKNGGILLTEGTISLQSESHPIDFRKVEILTLN